ncbi:MAG: KilA-N domain-containing protein [Terrimicrobiaceae bacterium]
MSKAKRTKIEVQGTAIAIVSQNSQDYIALTDMAQKFGDDVLIYSWMRNRNTLEFIGVWEQIHNPDFKGLEFETFKNQAGLNSFSLTPRKSIEAELAIVEDLHLLLTKRAGGRDISGLSAYEQ